MWCIVSVDARLNVNVALNRPSYQSSTYTDAYFGYFEFGAKYANDGNHGTNVYTAPCIHTLMDTNPWWAVDLGVALYVAGVKFTNRGDCCGMYNCTCTCMRPQILSHGRNQTFVLGRYKILILIVFDNTSTSFLSFSFENNRITTQIYCNLK